MKRLVVLVLALILVACDDPAPPHVGETARAVAAATISGQPLRLPQDRPVILRFWASWCPGCRDGLDQLQTLRTRHPAVMPVAINVGESAAQVAVFVRDRGLDYPLALDPDRAITRAYGVTGLPTTIVIDRHGVVRARLLGQTGVDALHAALKDLP